MVSDGQPDLAVLGAWLDERIDGFGALRSIEKFATGQSNPTYLLAADSGRYVLRAKPPGKLLKSAHAVDREYRVLQSLYGTAVPVARPYRLCTDDRVFGTMFYVMSYEEGRIFWDATLPELESNGGRTAIYDEFIRVLAELHRVDVDAVGLGDFGKKTGYYERQISRWTRQYQAAEVDPIPDMDFLIEWLPANTPAAGNAVALIHGDYRLDNMIFHPTEARVIAVLDWELSTLGHPIADLAYACMRYYMPTGGIKGLLNIDVASLGIPTSDEFVQRYCELTGRDDGIGHWNFYQAFSFFRLAAIVQGVYKRALDGNASNEKAIETGRHAAAFAALGARQAGARPPGA